MKKQKVSMVTLRELTKLSNTPNMSDESMLREAKKSGFIVTGVKKKKVVKSDWMRKLLPF